MAQQTINVGTSPNDGTGTPLRTAFQYTNSNFSELYTAVGPSGNNIVVPGSATITGDLTVRTTGLIVNTTGVGVNITPSVRLHASDSDNPANGTLRLGSAATYGQIKNSASSTGKLEFTSVGTGVNGGYNFSIEGQNAHRIEASGVFNWFDGAGGTRMTLNSTGLGVGDSPATKIFAKVTPPSAGQDGMRVSDGTRLIQMSISGSTYSYLGIGANQNVIYASGNPLSILSDSQNLRLGTGTNAYILLDTAGNVGVGVTPSAWGSTYRALQIGIGTSLTGVTNDVDANLTNNARFDGTNWKYLASSPAERYRIASGTHYWYNAASGTGGNNITWTQAMTLDASGNLYLKTTSRLSSGVFSVAYVPGTSQGAVFQPNVDTSSPTPIQFLNSSGSSVGSITTTASATAYNTSSDYRLKQSVQPLSGGLARVSALKPSAYKWKVDGSNGEGFLAHELAEVVPLAVTGDKDAVDADGKHTYQGVDLSKLVPILVAAIQELTAEVNALKNA